MRSVAADSEIAGRAEHLLANEVGWALHHHAGKVTAGRTRKDGVRHQADRGLDVGRVNGRSLDLDEDVFEPAPRETNLFDRKGRHFLRQGPWH